MKKKIRNIITLSLFFLSGSVLADSISIDPMQKISTQISTEEPNVIAVYNDKIVSMTSNSGLILSSKKTADGKIIFTTKSKKPFNVVVETETGFTFTINVKPSAGYSGASLVVYNKQAKGNSEATAFEENSLSYSGLITKTLTQFVNGKVPGGFIETRHANIQLPAAVTQYLNVQGVNSWNSASFVVSKYRVKNVSSGTIELNERYLWTPGVIAVSFSPNLTVLNPGAGVDAYIVTKGGDYGR